MSLSLDRKEEMRENAITLARIEGSNWSQCASRDVLALIEEVEKLEAENSSLEEKCRALAEMVDEDQSMG